MKKILFAALILSMNACQTQNQFKQAEKHLETLHRQSEQNTVEPYRVKDIY